MRKLLICLILCVSFPIMLNAHALMIDKFLELYNDAVLNSEDEIPTGMLFFHKIENDNLVLSGFFNDRCVINIDLSYNFSIKKILISLNITADESHDTANRKIRSFWKKAFPLLVSTNPETPFMQIQNLFTDKFSLQNLYDRLQKSDNGEIYEVFHLGNTKNAYAFSITEYKDAYMFMTVEFDN